MKKQTSSTFLEIGIMFIPAIPAYLWIWPNLSGTNLWVFQSLAYGYILAGTLYIGLRRWRWEQLGIIRRGIGLSLFCALVILAGRWLIVISVDLGLDSPQYSPLELVGNILFYFGLVALVEELLFRGLIYQALDEQLGARGAIWGSSFAFALWHLVGQGPLVGAVAFFFGLLFALIRWRAGGIIGLILLHGLFDLETVLMVADSNQAVLNAGSPALLHPGMMLLGLALLLLLPFYLWLIHPRLWRVSEPA